MRRYSAEDRERLIREQAESGMTKKAFCEQRGIHITTFHGWRKQSQSSAPQLAEVEVTAQAAPIEIALPSGKRLGLYLNGEDESLIKLIRGVLSC